MTDTDDDLRVVASAMPEASVVGTLWFGSIAIAGVRDGLRVAGVFDFATPFATAEEAKCYAREAAGARLRRVLPRSRAGNAKSSV